MTIVPTILDTETLLGVFTHTEPVSNYWRTLAFPTVFTSEDQFIDMEKIAKGRKLAPFVSPMNEGRPIFSEGSALSRFAPAYIKVKDAVSPDRVIKKRVGSMFSPVKVSPMARWDALTADIMQEHRDTIERRWEWMAAKAIIDGKVTVSGEGYPTKLVDFNRDPAHTVVLAGAAKWNGASANIIGNLNTWRALVRVAKFGGPVNRLTVGANVWEVMEKDPEVLSLLDTTVRGTESNNFNIGLREGGRVEYMGKIGTLEIWLFADTYEADGLEVPYMAPDDIVLTGPNVNGVQAFGAILDKGASFNPLPIFPSMWDSKDPSVTQIMNQSSPLMIPVNPNNTFKATVL
jgi:hypothetical protein